MPGRPQLKALTKQIENLGGGDYIFARIADGDSIAQIARDLEVSRQQIYRWADAVPERRDQMKMAVQMSADALAESAGEVLDSLVGADSLSSADVSLASHRAQYRRWLAGVRNRDVYGDSSGPTVQINVGSMHLDALRMAGSDPRAVNGILKEG
jgi:transposase-like protein